MSKESHDVIIGKLLGIVPNMLLKMLKLLVYKRKKTFLIIIQLKQPSELTGHWLKQPPPAQERMEKLMSQISSDKWRLSIWVHLKLKAQRTQVLNKRMGNTRSSQNRADISCTKASQFYEKYVKTVIM